MIRRVFLVPLLVATITLVACGESGHSAPPTRVTVAYVVDGDTLRVRLPAGTLEYVRLVGIDTPEEDSGECGAAEASASLAQLAPEGAAVRLRPDSIADERDRYGRLLAHAFVRGRHLEVVQLRRGWAELYRFQGQRFDGLARFERAEGSALRADRGVWSLCGGDFHSAR